MFCDCAYSSLSYNSWVLPIVVWIPTPWTFSDYSARSRPLTKRGGLVLIYLPCWLFSLLSFLGFLPKIRGVPSLRSASGLSFILYDVMYTTCMMFIDLHVVINLYGALQLCCRLLSQGKEGDEGLTVCTQENGIRRIVLNNPKKR